VNRLSLYGTPFSERPVPGNPLQNFADGPFRKFLGAALRAEMKKVVWLREDEI
jgi:hypothetical protein